MPMFWTTTVPKGKVIFVPHLMPDVEFGSVVGTRSGSSEPPDGGPPPDDVPPPPEELELGGFNMWSDVHPASENIAMRPDAIQGVRPALRVVMFCLSALAGVQEELQMSRQAPLLKDLGADASATPCRCNGGTGEISEGRCVSVAFHLLDPATEAQAEVLGLLVVAARQSSRLGADAESMFQADAGVRGGDTCQAVAPSPSAH